MIQMQATANALINLGLVVDTCFSDEVSHYLQRGYDIVHIFNIQTAEESWIVCNICKNRQLPVVLSTIYWEELPGWFFYAIRKHHKYWYNIHRILGYHPAYILYAWRQRIRYPMNTQWKVQQKLLMAADAWLPNSHAEARQILRDFRINTNSHPPIFIVPNAINRTLFDSYPSPTNDLPKGLLQGGFILQVGRISPEKNVLGLIQSLFDVDMPILFIGQPNELDPDYLSSCRESAQKRDHVYFLNFLPHQSLPGYYAAAALHALPSWRETPGLASLEAAAAGCRIVSTSIGSAYEYFGEEAYYCHPADNSSIRYSVLSALTAPRTNTLREHVLKYYTWEKAAQDTLKAYRFVLSNL